MKTKYVCRGLISPYVNFHNNPTKWSTNLLVKICRWGGKGKRAQISYTCIDHRVQIDKIPDLFFKFDIVSPHI